MAIFDQSSQSSPTAGPLDTTEVVVVVVVAAIVVVVVVVVGAATGGGGRPKVGFEDAGVVCAEVSGW